MHSQLTHLMAQEQIRDRLRDAADERLVREVRAARVASGGGSRLRRPRLVAVPHLARLGRAWLGRALASLGPMFRCPEGGPRWTA
jgi:hypothetical protein